MLAEIGRPLVVVFEFQISDEVCVQRLLARAAELEGRADDAPGGDRQAARALPRARPSRWCEHYRVHGQRSSGSTPSSREDEVFAELAGRARAGGCRVIIRKSAAEIDQMARAGRVVAETLALIGEHARAGRHDGRARRARRGVHPLAGRRRRRFKGYRGYPASICASPNEMVVHGIPGPYALADGDILSVDVGVTLGGFVGDSAFTFAVGEISPDAAAAARRLPGRARRRRSSSAARATGSPTSPTRSRP